MSRRRQLETSTVLIRFLVTPTELSMLEKLMKRESVPHRADVFRDALWEKWQRSEEERRAKKAAKADK